MHRDQAAARSGELPSVTAVIPTCNNARHVARVVESILGTGYQPLEIIVVENRPPAASTRAVATERFPGHDVRYLEEPRPGASWARNAGLWHAEGDLVAFADDDVVIDPGWIANAANAFGAGDDVACVTGPIRPISVATPMQRLFDDFSVLDKGTEQRIFRLPETREVQPLFPYIAGHIGSGANMIVRKDAAQAVGGFDTALGTPTLPGEDLDLFIRLLWSGFSIVYDPGVVVLHEHPDSLEQLRRHAYRYGLGLTAMFSKYLLKGPERLDLLTAIPAGVRYLFDPDSRKNSQKQRDYPKSLDLLEYLGMLLGPLAYARSLATAARHNRAQSTRRRRLRASGTGTPRC